MDKRHSQLVDALAALVPYQASIPYFVETAGLDAAAIVFQGNAYDIWLSVVLEAQRQGRVKNLIEAALSRFPNDPFLLTALKAEVVDYSFGPKVNRDLPWNGTDADTLEVLTQENVNTIMPIGFLEFGLIRARQVAKVQLPVPGGVRSGTGFLIENNILITNNHVIPDKAAAANAKAIFNFEDDLNRLPKPVTAFDLDPEYMITSPVKEYDTTAIRIKGNANRLFGSIALNAPQIPIAKNQFVNIIQHPAGQPKKIALYHNIVTSIDDRKVQYLTDTLQGSSGSPVFNSDWEVVALHHSGGDSQAHEPANKLSAFRNEGINILRVIDLIQQGIKEGKL
jgi:V8-like Glu-specific endopeptidase